MNREGREEGEEREPEAGAGDRLPKAAPKGPAQDAPGEEGEKREATPHNPGEVWLVGGGREGFRGLRGVVWRAGFRWKGWEVVRGFAILHLGLTAGDKPNAKW